MIELPNMVGQRFGRLVVLAQTKTRHKRAYWICRCDCGNECSAMGKSLRQGKKRSCGCLQRESNQKNAVAMHAANNLPTGEAAFNLLYAGYRCSAEQRCLEFKLTKEEFKNLTQDDCFYCGQVPNRIYAPDLPNGGYVYNGVDRHNNSIGYVLENSVSCCKFCNWMKNTYTAEDFLNHCFSIVDYQNRKKQAEMTCSSNNKVIAA